MIITSIFSFSHSVFQSLVKPGLFAKELIREQHLADQSMKCSR